MTSFQKFIPFFVLLTACGGLSTGDVKSLDRYTHNNKFYEYEYLTIPDSASLPDLVSVTKEIIARKGRTDQKQDVYNYYLGANRAHKFAILNIYRTRRGEDTVEVVLYPKQQNSPHAKAISDLEKLRETDPYNHIPDTCMGVWRNWANPFGFYVFVYKQKEKYYVKHFSAGLGGTADVAIPDSNLTGKLFRVDKLGVETSRYKLNKYNDLYATDEDAHSGEYMTGIYDYICDCPQKQEWPL